jgi:hypothetical protein
MKQCKTCGEVYETKKTCPCPKRGGARAGAGRKARPTSKAKGIWCGQIADDKRDFIMLFLSPDERYKALLAAANTACTGLGAAGTLQKLSKPIKLPARRASSKPSPSQ